MVPGPLRAALSRLDRRYEEAASTLGAGPLRRLRKVILPLLWPALAAGFSLVALYAVFAASCFVAPGIVNRWGGKRSLALGVAAALWLRRHRLLAAGWLVACKERG